MKTIVIYRHGDNLWGVSYLPCRQAGLPAKNLAVVRPVKSSRRAQKLGFGLLALALGGLVGPFSQSIRLETQFSTNQLNSIINEAVNPSKPLPPAAPVVFNPLLAPDGSVITPVDSDFSVIIPKIGVNAKVIPAVNPANVSDYLEALKQGVAHASTSYFPDENGTVYLFSHSTNYDWFVKDLNAVFYLLKNLETGDLVVLFYQGKSYAYKITAKQVVSPDSVSYLAPARGSKRLILQTCWPPGSTTQRLLIFADLFDEGGQSI